MLENFEGYLSEWEVEEEESNQLTHPQNVPSHYKKYTMEEKNILVQKPNQENLSIGVSNDGIEDAKKIDLASP